MLEKRITPPLTLGRTLLYSCASIGLNIMSITVSTWLLYFYAPPPDSGRTQYLSITLVGMLLTAGRLWDAVIDPLIGYWSDVNHSRWGRRRPFLMFATPVTAIALLLLWTPPATGSGLLNALYFFFVTLAFYTSLSLVSIPYDSSLPEMAAIPADYVPLSMWKNIFGTTGVFIGALLASPLFGTVGPLAMAMVVGGIGLVTIWLTLFGLQEKNCPASQPIGVRSSLRLTFGNRQFLSMFVSTLMIHVAYAMLLANLPYFVTLVVGKTEADVSIFQGVVVVTMVVFAPVWNCVPKQVFETRLTLAEAVYRECDFLFVDEADRVQVKFDEEFAPNQVLVDQSGTSFLNKLGLNLAEIYQSDRGSMIGDRFVAWISAHYHIQNATNRLYHLLLTQGQLVEWLGRNPFTGYSLFARIIYDLTCSPANETEAEVPRLTRQERIQERRRQIVAALSPDQEHRRRKALIEELQDFLRSPLNCHQSRSIWSRSLSNLAFTVLSAETDRQALIEVENWCKTWLEQHQTLAQDETFEQFTHHVHFAVLTAVLDDRLGFLVDHLTELSQSRIVDLHDLDQAIVHRPPRDYLPVVPEAPVGNILGFLYKCDRRNFKKSGKLEYFRYVGVGRTLLLSFPTLFAVDGWDGAHTVLISGTSYAPGSPSYHINAQPTVLLKPAQEDSSDRSGIHASEFFFAPMRRPTDGKFIQLSGLPVAQRRLAADQLVRAMCESPGKVPSFLAKCFQELAELERTNPEWWSDRQRLLIVTGSYDEADWIGEILRPLYRLEQLDSEGVATLRRDNAPARPYSLRRGEISELQHTPIQIVIAPLMALERGHNILNAQKKAAIGAVLFLNRPMPIPDDWQFTVRQLNNWALTHEKNPILYDAVQAEDEHLTLTRMGEIFYLNAVSEMLNLNCTAFSFKQLTHRERNMLCWTQLVSIWQIIGRLLRGNVPARVYFMDAKFAPESAYGLADSEVTSLLIGIIKALQVSRDNTQHAYERTLLRSLYDIFLEKLQNIFKDSNDEL